MTPIVCTSKLQYGGVWYLRGTTIEMNDRDAEDYLAMRMGVVDKKYRPKQKAPAINDVITKTVERIDSETGEITNVSPPATRLMSLPKSGRHNRR